MMQKTQHTTKIIAHRGDVSQFPENTLEAFESALANGADGIELDVHMTSDGELIVHHDYYLGNPDNGSGKVFEVAYPYVRNLIIPPHYHLPTLDEVFAKFGNSLHYEIEIKAFTDMAIDRIVRTVHQHGLIESTEFTSPHSFVLTRLKQSSRQLTAGFFAFPQPEWMDSSLYQSLCIAHTKLGRLDVLHVPSPLITEKFVRDAHIAGFRIHAADCNDKEDLQRVIALGVDQLSTNQLTLAVNAVNTQASQY